MERGAKPKAKVEAMPPAARKSRKGDGSTGRQLEQRLAEALEQQAATSGILHAISSSPTDLDSVFRMILANATRLCGASVATLWLFDGELLSSVAHQNASPEFAEYLARARIRPSRETTTRRAALERKTIHVADLLSDPDYSPPEFQRKEKVRTVLSVPLLGQDTLVGVVTLWRREVRPFTDKQVALVETFADQAVIAIENVRLFNETKEALERQTATAEILKVIASSPTDVQPVFDVIVESAVRLCGARFGRLYRYDGSVIQMVAGHGLSTNGLAQVQRVFPRSAADDTIVGRVILTRRPFYVRDIEREETVPALSRQMIEALGTRSQVTVPMLCAGEPIGATTMGWDEPEAFDDQQVALLQTFADQAVIAIENVRLFNETKEALDQQTATAEILQAISSSPGNLQPVFDTLVRAAARFCGAPDVLIVRLDGGALRGAAAAGLFERTLVRNAGRIDAVEYPLTRGSVSGRAVLERRTIHIHDLAAASEDEYPEGRQLQRQFGTHTVVATPFLREDVALGAIVLARPEIKPFSDKQLQLLRIFADQAVIAIENVRLFKELEARNAELTEALEQQTATSDILRVISRSPTDVQPVFDTIAAAAMKLCRAGSVTVTTFDGELLHLAALAIVNPDGADAVRKLYPQPPGREHAAPRAVLTCKVAAIPDVLEDPEYAIATTALASGFRSVLAVPLLRERSPIGAITIGRPEPGPFPDKQVALLKTFADQAVIAIENARLVNELEARTTQLTRSVGELQALGEVGQAVGSTLNLETVLRTIVSRATQLAGMDGGAIYEYDETREQFYLHATDKLPDELIEVLRAAPIRKGEGALGRMAVTGEPVQIRDIEDEASYQSRLKRMLVRLGYRSLLAVPLLREDHLLGGLVVNRKSAGEFTPEVIDLMKTFATQSALAIQNARLFREIEEKSRQLETASRHKSDFLANMSHELRTPLNAIIGFSEVLLERLFGELNDKQADYLNDIHSSGRHLLSLINDILDLSKIEAGRMELEPSGFELSEALSNAMTLVRERAQRHGIVMAQQLDAELGEIVADERKFKQILVNLLSNAVKFTPDGGRIDVRVRREDGNAVIAVHDTGIGIAPEDQAAVFEEFRQVGRDYTNKQEGTGLGLALTKKFVELHGGRIWLESEPGKGSTFTFTIPMTR
jgi:GAF domain-containing protein